jgi:hypothetical protein
LSAPFLSAGVLLLKDGRFFDDIPMQQVAGGYTVQFEHGQVLVPERLVEAAILDSDEVSPYVAKNADEEAKLADGLVPFQGRWMSVKNRDKKLKKIVDDKRAEVLDYESHLLWRDRYKVKTKNFYFEHNIPPNVFDRYSKILEAYFDIFRKDWKIKPKKGLGKDPRDHRLLICFYNDRDYFQQVGGAPRGALGYFRFVKPLELNVFYDKYSEQDTIEVMFHEVGHYLHKLIDVNFKYPHFPGECLAEYYGASYWDAESETLTSGLILEGRLTEVKTDIAKGDMMTLAEMMNTGPYEDYTWGWTFVHFLMNDSRYEKNFKKFFTGLAKDKKIKRKPFGIDNLQTVPQREIMAIFMKYMKLKSQDDLLAMQQEWYDYINNDLQVTSAFGLEKAADNARRHSRHIRARRLYQEALETGEASAQLHYKYAWFILKSAKDNKKERSSEELEEERTLLELLFRKASEIDPLTAVYHACLGHFIKAVNDDLEDGERMILLANDIGPKEDVADALKSLTRYISID